MNQDYVADPYYKDETVVENKIVLINKLKEKSQSRSDKQPVNSPEETIKSLMSEVDKYKNLYKNTNSELKKVKKQRQLKPAPKNKLVVEQNKQLKHTIYLLKQEMDALSTDNKNLLHSHLLMEEEFKQQIAQLESTVLDNSKTIKHLSVLKPKYDSAKKGFNTVNKKYLELKRHNRGLSQRVNELSLELKQQDKSLKIKTLEAKSIMSLSPSILLQQLKENLSLENVHEYQTLAEISQRKNHLLSLKKNLKLNNGSTEVKKIEERFGYVTLIDGIEVFMDVNGERYQVKDKVKHPIVYDASPVQALLHDDGQVSIIHVYKQKDVNLSANREKEKALNSHKRKNQPSYHHIGDFNVLVVSDNNREKYVERLRKHGLRVKGVEAYSKTKRLKDILDSYDLVLFLSGSLSPTVAELLKNHSNPDKFQVILNPNTEKVVQRVVYAKHRLKL